LTKELDICNDSISCLRTKNVSLIAKIEELNTCKVSTSTIEHVTIWNRCRDVNVDAMNDHLPMIKEQNDHIAKLNAKIAEHELENENFKFIRNILYNGIRPRIKDGIGSFTPEFMGQSRVHLIYAPEKTTHIIIEYIEINVTISSEYLLHSGSLTKINDKIKQTKYYSLAPQC
jgi:hypothetical protein